MSMLDLSLIAHVRRGSLKFQLLVDVLSGRGYVTDTADESGLGLISATIEQAGQDDFDALFKVLMPGELNDIKIRAIATDKGGPPGSFTYALFNENVISYEDVMAVLIDINKGVADSLQV